MEIVKQVSPVRRANNLGDCSVTEFKVLDRNLGCIID
jgi:hypothetical protein